MAADLTEEEQAAKDAGLRYVHDDAPGFTRVPQKDGFRYLDQHGKPITDEKVLERIRSLAIPPAYTHVWVCANARGHVQATGKDARGRKQYRYHPRWREVRDAAKYERMLEFAATLPRIRERVQIDLARKTLDRERILATVVALLESTLIRIGNEEYAKENKSFGLTTMLTRHVDVHGADLRFRFRGKSGVRHDIHIHDAKVAKVIRKLQDLPGQELFSYIGDHDALHGIMSDDVNAYIAEISGAAFTAKDFRTWAGTVACAIALGQIQEPVGSKTEAKRQLTKVIADVSSHLGNTPSVCRKCYIHPTVIDTYLEHHALPIFGERSAAANDHGETGLRPEERAVVRFLEHAA